MCWTVATFMGNGRMVSICNVCRDDMQVLVSVQRILHLQGSRIDHAIQYLECVFNERRIKDASMNVEHCWLFCATVSFDQDTKMEAL